MYAQENFSDLEKIILLQNICIGNGRKLNRSRIKALYEIYRYQCWREKRGIKNCRVSRKKIGGNACQKTKGEYSKITKGLCEKTISRFVNSQAFPIFCVKIPQEKKYKGCANGYELKRDIFDVFSLLNRRGVMRDIYIDFKRFHMTFKNFIGKAIISELENGKSLDMVLNKLSTKIKRICPTLTPQYVPQASILALASNSVYTKLGEASPLQNFDNKNLPLGIEESFEVASLLSQRLGLNAPDIRVFLHNNSVSVISQSANELLSRIDKGWKPKSNVRALQSIIGTVQIERQRSKNVRRVWG